MPARRSPWSTVRTTPSAALFALVAALACGCGRQASTRPEATTATAHAPAPPRPRSRTPHPSPSPAVARPPIVRDEIPFGAQREREMAAYARRHYGIDDYRLIDPHVIVEHFTVTDSVRATYDSFAADVADVELHELPGLCSHFVIATDGAIHQLVPVGLMCRHTVGLNYTAVGIEHVGRSDAEILGNAPQLAASQRLTTWLRCRFDIKISNVIGHNESLSSPYHRENVARLRAQTHEDFNRTDMDVYRRKLRRLRCA